MPSQPRTSAKVSVLKLTEIRPESLLLRSATESTGSPADTDDRGTGETPRPGRPRSRRRQCRPTFPALPDTRPYRVGGAASCAGSRGTPAFRAWWRTPGRRRHDVEVDRHRTPIAVTALDWVHKVQVRDLRQRCGRLPLPGGVVGARRREARVSNQHARHLVVGNVVRRRGGQDDRWLDPPQRLGDPPPRFIVVEDRHVPEFKTDVRGPDQARRGPRLLAPDRRDLFSIMFGTTAIARRHRRDRDLTTRLAQQNQGPGALELHVIRMGMQGEYADRCGHIFPFAALPHGCQVLVVILRCNTSASPEQDPSPGARSSLNCEAKIIGFFSKMFSRALANLCTLAAKESVTDRPCP